MEKLKMQTENLADRNFETLSKLFPNAVTETIDEATGEVVRAIDADVLRQEISTAVVEGREERYQFTWPDKKQAVLLANTPINKTLRPVREKSVGRDGTEGGFDSENIYIEGDNLDVLKLLRNTYLGKVKMIYIDPPYNTGNDFVYEDDFVQSMDEYMNHSGQFDEDGNRIVQNTESNGRYHTDWLNMLYPRLRIARDLLRDDGAIFISMDDHEVENLRKLCDEVFGESNLVAVIPWQSRASIQNDTDFSVNHEYIAIYAKNRRKENRRLKESNASEWYKKDSFVCKPLPLDPDKYDNPDNDPRGPWKADPFDAPHIRPNLTYPITNPNTGDQHLPPSGRCWRISPEKFSSALEDNRIVWTNNGKGRPQLKVFYNEKKDFGSIDNSWFSADKIGTSTQGTKELMSLFDGVSYFDTPKPTSLLKKLITLANTSDGDIILDFFSGSATTADALLGINSECGGTRQFIMVQVDELTYDAESEKKNNENDEEHNAYIIDPKTGYPRIKNDSAARKAGYWTICDIGEERIRRAGKKIKEEAGADIDYGFRVFKLDSSNMKDVYYRPVEEEQYSFGIRVDNIKSDRSPEDLLFQVMLDMGILLSETIAEEEIDGKKVFNVGDGFLIACFDENVTDETVKAIAQKKPRYAVFRDSSMANDSVMANFDQIFETYSKETVRKVL